MKPDTIPFFILKTNILMAKTGATGLTRIINAAGYSWQGLKKCYETEAAFRQELLLSVVLSGVALWLDRSGMEKALLIGVVILVLITELLNTGIEYAVDRIGGEHHEYSGIAKDIGSAAVFVALLNVPVVWVLVLFF